MRTPTSFEIHVEGLNLALPEGTEVVSEQPLLLALPAIDGPAPWLLITPAAEPVPSLEDWVADELERQQRSLQIPLLLAHEPCELFGLPAILTLHHHGADGRATTLVQRWAAADGEGVMAAAACATAHYHLVAPLVDEILRGARFDAD